MSRRHSRLLVELAEILRDDKLIGSAREHNQVLYAVKVFMRRDRSPYLTETLMRIGSLTRYLGLEGHAVLIYQPTCSIENMAPPTVHVLDRGSQP